MAVLKGTIVPATTAMPAWRARPYIATQLIDHGLCLEPLIDVVDPGDDHHRARRLLDDVGFESRPNLVAALAIDALVDDVHSGCACISQCGYWLVASRCRTAAPPGGTSIPVCPP